MQRYTTQRGAIRQANELTRAGMSAGARPVLTSATTPSPRAVARSTGPAILGGRSGLLALLPLTCAVHCMVTPVLVAFVPALGVAPSIEWILLAGSVAVAMLALRRGARFYRNRLVWALAGSGAAIWALSLLSVFEPLPETVTSPLGGAVLAAALFWKGRLSHRHACRDCGCPMH